MAELNSISFHNLDLYVVLFFGRYSGFETKVCV